MITMIFFDGQSLIDFLFGLLQVYPEGIRHIRADKRVNEWKSPGKKTISKCAINERQVVIALSGGELVYFEMDPVSGLAVATRDGTTFYRFFV